MATEGLKDLNEWFSEEPSTIHRIQMIEDGIPPDRLILEGVDTSKPTLSISEVTKMFFGRSSHWGRWVDREGYLILDGEYVGGTRSEKSNARVYTLSDVEKMIHALGVHRVLNGEQVVHALTVVVGMARVWRFIP